MNRERIGQLFEQALDLPVASRAEWIARQCAGDDITRTQVERLLRADAEAQDFMEQPPALVADATSAAASEHVAPRAFGAYRVVRSIGFGGMGEVWLAERNDGDFEQRVAVKQLAYPTPGLLQRFRQERRILARLEHPHIARLIDGGVDARGIPYLVMEYVEGVPITAHVRDAALTLQACLLLFLRVCEAVQYAHQNLIVHRDLKPSNIFVSADGTPKLLDFGIAKVLTTADTDAPTQTMARLLTPDYAAPEQFSGGAITTATDVYALGVVLYELLTGSRPRREVSAAGIAAASGPPPPSAAIGRTMHDANARRRLLRGDLDRIVLTAMAGEANRRYSSAEALAADIRSYLDGRPIAARPDSPWYRLRKFAKRNRYLVGASALVVAVCVVATAISLHLAQQANQQAARALAARQFLAGVFEQASPNQSKGKSMTAHELLEKGERQLVGRFDAQPAIRADLTGLIGGLYRDIGDYERASALLSEAEKLTGDPRVPDEINARNLAALASIEIDNRDNQVAAQHARRALLYAERAGADGIRERSEARRILATVSLTVENGDGDETVIQLHELLADDQTRFGERSDFVAKDLGILGIALDNVGRHDEAIDASRRALEINRVEHGEHSIEVGDNLFYIGMSLWGKDDYAGAESALAKATEIRSKIYGAANPETIDTRMYVLLMQEEQNRYAEALPERLRLLELQRRLGDSNPKMLANANGMLGVTYIMLGKPLDAERVLRESLAIWTRVQGTNDNILSLRSLGNLATALQMQGRYAEAEAAQREALATAAANTPAGSDAVVTERASLGNLLRLQHRYAEALTELRGAAAVLENGHGGISTTMKLYARLAEAELDAGNPDRASAPAARAVELGRARLSAGNPRLASPLFALARADLSRGQAAQAALLLRETLAIRSPPIPAEDLRVIEVKVALVDALAALGRTDEAHVLRSEIEPLLESSALPYAKDLLARLPPKAAPAGGSSMTH